MCRIRLLIGVATLVLCIVGWAAEIPLAPASIVPGAIGRRSMSMIATDSLCFRRSRSASPLLPNAGQHTGAREWLPQNEVFGVSLLAWGAAMSQSVRLKKPAQG